MLILAVLATVATGLMAGTMFTYGVAVLPGMTRLEDREFVRSFTVTDEALEHGPFLAPVFLGAPLLAGACIVVAWPGEAAGWFAVAFLGLALTALITVVVHRSLNAALKRSPVDDPRSGRAALRERRWLAWHQVRIVATIVATAAMSMGLASLG